MDQELFRVTKDEYVSFLETIKPNIKDTRFVEETKYNRIQIYNKNSNQLICERYTPKTEDGTSKFYIYLIPESIDRLSPIPHTKINLETREEVQAFFDFLSKRDKKHD